MTQYELWLDLGGLLDLGGWFIRHRWCIRLRWFRHVERKDDDDDDLFEVEGRSVGDRR